MRARGLSSLLRMTTLMCVLLTSRICRCACGLPNAAGTSSAASSCACFAARSFLRNSQSTRQDMGTTKLMVWLSRVSQGPLNVPFLEKRAVFQRISRGKTALRHSGQRPTKIEKRPVKVRNGRLRGGNAPLSPMGTFRALRHGGKRPLKKGSLIGL